MKAVRLKTEYMTEPIGIDADAPKLTWNCENGTRQTAYRIEAYDDSGRLLWDSGRVSGSSMGTKWGGEPIFPRTKVIWKIRLWDENGEPGEESVGSFELGLPVNEPWNAQWITGDYSPEKKRRYPVDCFRKTFSASDIKKARLYITACGLYEARLNGAKVGNFILAPGITDYRKRVQYQTYDVTELLNEGENSITVQLADGWYRGSCGAWGLKNQYGTVTKFIAMLEITDSSGNVRTVRTDKSWQWSNDGAIRFADNKDGELIDSRRSPSYSGKARETEHNVVPSASNNVPVTEHESFKAVLIKTPGGKTVLDFGQNIAGYISFGITAEDGQRVKLRFGETLDGNGEFTQKNIQCSNKKITTPLQEIKYICRAGRNEYKTTFAIFGFRYVLVEGDIDPVPEDFTAIAVYSDMERTGYFESSNELLNKFFDCTLWSAKNNSCDLPTDCPTRERHGWTGDAQIFCGTAAYLFDYMPFAKKFLNDMYDWQKKNGCLPQIAPGGGKDFFMRPMDGCIGWADAGVIIPYVLWKQYGDTDVLKKYLPGMRKYAAFMQKRCGRWFPTAKYTGLKGDDKRYLSNCGQAYGEWAEPDDVHHMTWKDCAVPHPETATAYTAYVMGLMSEIEDALGNAAEAKQYADFSENCCRSYRALVSTKQFSLDTDRQARLVRPLAFGLLDGRLKRYAEKRLLKALDSYGWRVGTGFLSTPLIMDVLADIDINAAYRLLENEEMPGWLFMPKNGATTVWEAWEGNSSPNGGIASLDHYSKGAVCRWLFDTMCGIKVSGENSFTIAPRPGGNFSYARAEYASVYGKISSGWRKNESGVEFTVTVPANCTAIVRLPDRSEVIQEAGERVYQVRCERDGTAL